jgi:CRISPR/Cas system-associated exonuclease Cas4 (RecB family)
MLKTFEQCQKKYYLKYIERISVPQKAGNFEKGKKIHALAHYYLRGDDTAGLETALTEEEYRIWEQLKANEYFQKTYINSEYNLSCKTGDFWVGGRLDALMRGSESYYILDYKTGAIPKNPESDFQTTVYLLAAEKLYTPLQFVYIDLKNNQSRLIEFNNEIKSGYEKAIIDICTQITNAKNFEDFEASKKCEFCEFKKICL